MALTVSYIGRQGHRLLASQDINPGNPNTCLDLQAMSDAFAASNAALSTSLACGAFFADTGYFIPPGTVLPNDLHLPYGSTSMVPAGTTVGANGISIPGLRPFSSPNCEPMTGVGCPPDSIPVFSSIFTQNTIANSSYNGLQLSVEKRFSHGLQFQASYTLGKSLDYASTFESLVDPVNPKRNRSLSLFDSRHRFVFSYYWELPVPKYDGFKGKALNGWSVSGITTFQTGFPIRITSQDDVELQGSFDFETPGQPNRGQPFQRLDPRGPGNLGFNPDAFTNDTVTPGTIGNAPRTVCCGPGLNNWEFSFQKQIPLSERLRLEFHGELFNAFNHAQFFQPDGNITDGADFGRVKRARDPRLVQFALKLYF